MNNQFASVKRFMEHHFRHFNASVVVDAANGWIQQLEQGNRMLLTMAGAMSTAELGISLSEMIRQDKVHAIACTGANLEEDVYNLVAHNEYKRVANWRALSAVDELELFENGFNRVTDTCIPEDEAMRRIEKVFVAEVQKAEAGNERVFPHEIFYRILSAGTLEAHYQIDPRDSWLAAAAKKNLPLFVPGWEDSTMGNMYVASQIRGVFKNMQTIKSGLEYMRTLVDWYSRVASTTKCGFFQIGGGIAGDFTICVVPLLNQDLKRDVPYWSYFCQISDSTTSYGSYSGAVPDEKITWGKLETTTPRFIIESDASIVAPLIFAYVLA